MHVLYLRLCSLLNNVLIVIFSVYDYDASSITWHIASLPLLWPVPACFRRAKSFLQHIDCLSCLGVVYQNSLQHHSILPQPYATIFISFRLVTLPLPMQLWHYYIKADAIITNSVSLTAAAGLWYFDDCSVLHRVKFTRRYNLDLTDSPATSTFHCQLALGESIFIGNG